MLKSLEYSRTLTIFTISKQTKMAQHIEIDKAPFDLIFNLTEPDQFRDNPFFKRVPFKVDNKKSGEIYLLSDDYLENRGRGLKGDEYALMLNLKGSISSFEVHFNYKNQINKVYQVI